MISVPNKSFVIINFDTLQDIHGYVSARLVLIGIIRPGVFDDTRSYHPVVIKL